MNGKKARAKKKKKNHKLQDASYNLLLITEVNQHNNAFHIAN